MTRKHIISTAKLEEIQNKSVTSIAANVFLLLYPSEMILKIGLISEFTAIDSNCLIFYPPCNKGSFYSSPLYKKVSI